MGNPDALSFHVLYLNPPDYPGKAVIREQRVLPGGQIVVAKKARVFGNDCAAYLWGELAHLGTWLDRDPDEDDKTIVGTWMA